MRPRRRRSSVRALLVRASIAVFVCGPALSLSLPAAEWRIHATTGYDTFVDRFTILETDTLESVQEIYLGLGSSLSLRKGRTGGGIGNLFKIGNQTIDDILDLEASAARGGTGVDFRGNVHWKHFQPGSNYEFGNDYLQANSLLRFRRALGGPFRLNLKTRFETIDYKARTIFDYDYRYLDGGIEIERESDIEKTVAFGCYVGFKEAPDTTALSYRRTILDLEARLPPSNGLSFTLESVGDRRDYRETVRSSYWSVTSFLEVTVNLTGGTSLSLRGESELTNFDRPDTIFFDMHFMRAGLKVRHPLGTMSDIVIEPRYARMLCSDFAEERYGEASVILGMDLLRSAGFWVSASYEPGYRSYVVDPNELYSDFSFNRVSLMASIPLPVGTTLNVFATHDPERHSRRTDDFAVTLLSVDVTKRF